MIKRTVNDSDLQVKSLERMIAHLSQFQSAYHSGQYIKSGIVSAELEQEIYRIVLEKLKEKLDGLTS